VCHICNILQQVETTKRRNMILKMSYSLFKKLYLFKKQGLIFVKCSDLGIKHSQLIHFGISQVLPSVLDWRNEKVCKFQITLQSRHSLDLSEMLHYLSSCACHMDLWIPVEYCYNNAFPGVNFDSEDYDNLLTWNLLIWEREGVLQPEKARAFLVLHKMLLHCFVSNQYLPNISWMSYW
jgi:hypothetical protein